MDGEDNHNELTPCVDNPRGNFEETLVYSPAVRSGVANLAFSYYTVISVAPTSHSLSHSWGLAFYLLLGTHSL